MEMHTFFEADGTGVVGDDTTGVRTQIRELNAERRLLMGEDLTMARRVVATARYRRRISQASATEREAHLKLRRSLSIVRPTVPPTRPGEASGAGSRPGR